MVLHSCLNRGNIAFITVSIMWNKAKLDTEQAACRVRYRGRKKSATRKTNVEIWQCQQCGHVCDKPGAHEAWKIARTEKPFVKRKVEVRTIVCQGLTVQTVMTRAEYAKLRRRIDGSTETRRVREKLKNTKRTVVAINAAACWFCGNANACIICQRRAEREAKKNPTASMAA